MRTQDFNSVLFSCGPSSLGHLQLGGLRPLEALATQPWSAVSSIALGFRREAIAHPLDGFGMLVPAKEGRRILGTLFSSTLFAERAPAGHVLLTVFVGGRQPEYAALADSDLEKLVLEELRELVGLGGQPVFRSRHHWPRAIPKYGREFGALAASMDNFEHEYPGLHLAGNYRTGISLGDCISAGLAAAAKIGGQP
jgi:oxygen-dependent protoporphyrinogen oxidase